MTYRLQLRKDAASYWTIVDPVLAEGEPGFESDTNRLKIGDGTTAWNDLEYISSEVDLSSYATQSYVQSASANVVSYLVDSAPSTLNTLNELAAALNDDASFSTTVTNSLASKLDASSASTTYLTQASASTTYATSSYVDTEIDNSNGTITSILTVSASTSPYAIGAYEKWVRFGTAGSGNQAYVTFPSASSNTNREIVIVNTVYGVGVKSMSSDVRNLSGTVTDTVFSFEPGKTTAALVSDGQYWTIVSRS